MKIKKIIFSSIAMLLISVVSYSQSDSTKAIDFASDMMKMLNTKISMEVDSTLYDKRQGNFYISEKPQAMIMAMTIPEPFDQAKKKISEDIKRRNVVIKNVGEMEANGKKIAFKTGEMTENGEKMMIELYAVEATTENTIFITGVYLPKDKLRFANSAKKAASTAKLESNK